MARNKNPEQTVNLIIEKSTQLFISKGFDDTSIQDIIDNLGGLSKGAIYHHFKSKEEIFEAVCNKIGEQNSEYYGKIRDNKDMTGREKLRQMIISVCSNPANAAVVSLMEKFLSDSHFFVNQIKEIYEFSAPYFIKPVIEQGISDGTIKTDYPKELSEVIMTLMNIWINPAIAQSTPEEMEQKMRFFNLLMQSIGVDILDESDIMLYVEYGKLIINK